MERNSTANRNEQFYQRWVDGDSFRSIARENGLSSERVRQICEVIAQRKNPNSWSWISRFNNRTIAILIKNNIHNESELHEWWGDGKELEGTGATLASINENLETPLVYMKEKEKHYHVIDLTGQRFGRLTVIKKAKIHKDDGAYWECLCDCGNTTEVASKYLRSGLTKSCGCLAGEYRASLHKAGGIKGSRVIRCFKCKHHVDGFCGIWQRVTDEYGFCYRGERSAEA